MIRKDKKLFFILFAIIFIFSKNSHAYIDPGMGSMFIQSVIAIFALGFSSIIIFWNKLKNFLKLFFNKIKKSSK